MIDITRATSSLRQHYPSLEKVSDRVFRAFDRYKDNAYAVRYFDFNENLFSTVDQLRDYQDKLLGKLYFDPNGNNDLRWNHYLYFIISKELINKSGFDKAKAKVESDHEYARKRVVTEDELEHLLKPNVSRQIYPQQLPPDLVSTWMQILDGKGLGFVLDEDYQIPEVSRRITAGKLQRLRKPLTTLNLDPSELAVNRDIISKLSIKGFRKHPIPREFEFGEVNLIVGVNAAGKTSLLEAIEYLYCGKTKRSGQLIRGTTVSAILKSSGLTFETSPSTDPKKLRARHLNWYGKNELRTLNIDESFGKFNFLDTDAAVGLTVEMSKERISQDITHLLLGAQAGKALDRLNRVSRELNETCKSVDKDIAFGNLRQRESQDRLQALLNTPNESDKIFPEVLIAIDRINWRKPPQSKLECSNLSLPIQIALTEAQTLEKLALPASTLEESALVSRCNRLKETIETLKRLHKQQIEISETGVQVERQVPPLLSQLAAIESLAPYITSKLETLLLRQRELGLSIGQLTSALANTKSADAFSPGDDLRQDMLITAVTKSHSRLSELRQQASDVRLALENYERTQADTAALRQQLRSIAQEILVQVPDKDHCPLCHNKFQQGELLERMLSNVDTAEEEKSLELRSRLQLADKAVSDALSETRALEGLQSFVGPKGVATLSVSAALRKVTSGREQLDAEQNELNRINIRLAELESNGFTSGALQELKTIAQVKGSLPSLEDLEAFKKDLLEALEKHHHQLAALKLDLHIIEDNCEALAREHCIDVTFPIEVLKRQLDAKLHANDRALKAMRTLSDVMVLSPFAVDPTELSVRLGQVHALLVQLATCLARESTIDTEVKKAHEILCESTKNIEELSIRKQHIEYAQAILNELLNNYSEQTLSEQVLKENGKLIASTFSSIHVPNEFDLKTDFSGLRIVRRESEHEVGLHEMSTGQRAAYALSLFLAMNARLERGPKVLLFDDPIAHIDDINVLSFLDHLRELALKGTRQIFFATADSQVAGLFRHKFRFLGERFREIRLTRQG
ncbi:AAA family ATPase [Geomonas oryzae]|uniref:AAA family ATPase n=1 Tax=Geomonas oryzae TaxID=2364273 RepID=UPI00100A8BA6|nr:AAA family ATPase [Geomonas oryzae]